MIEAREQLATFVKEQTEHVEAWQTAELHLLEQALRGRLAEVGVSITPDVATAIMTTALLVARHTPEFGGDVRCTLGEIAMLGFALLDDPGDAGGLATGERA